MAAKTKARHLDVTVEISSFTTKVLDLLLTYSGDSRLWRRVLLSLYSTVYFASAKRTSKTAAVNNLSTMIQDLDWMYTSLSLKSRAKRAAKN